MVFGSFGSSSFLCLGITLVLIGILGYLISRKFQEQNHKITTMCELVTTMAQDIQMIKMQSAVDKIQHTLSSQPQSSTINVCQLPNGCSTDAMLVDKLEYMNVDTSNKIVVSDDEDSYGDDEEDDEEGSDASTLENYEEEEEYELEEDDIEVTEICETKDGDCAEAVIDIDMDMSLEEPAETKHIELAIEPEIMEALQDASEHPHIVVNKLESSPSPVPFELEENVDLSTNPVTENPLASIFSSANKQKKPRQSRSVPADETGEGLENLENFNGDYTKLNVAQLKKIVNDRGLSSHATKLKKTELLQLLGGGSSSAVVELDMLDM